MQDLPVEVWRRVIGNLAQNDVCSLCLVSQHLQGLAQPYLFTTIQYNWNLNDKGPPLRVAGIVRTLHRRRNLADAVRSVALVSTTKPGHPKQRVEMKSSVDDYSDPVQAALQPKLPFALGLSKVNELGQMDAFITLLLALTPNITGLKLTEHFAERPRMLAKLSLHAAADQASPLRHLAHVEYLPTLDLFRKSYGTNADDVLPFFYLPSLETFRAHMDNPNPFKWPLREPPSLKRLTHLTLRHTREHTLAIILSRVPSLKYLDWTWQYEHDRAGHYNSPVMKLDVLDEALRHFSDTLTTLKLTGVAYGIYETPEIMRIGSMKWLRDMTCITTLEIAPVFVTGLTAEQCTVSLYECLPSSLRRVCFTDDFHDHEDFNWTSDEEIEAIEAWRKHKDEWTPNLQQFELRYEKPERSEWSAADREALVRIGASYHIEVEIPNRSRWAS